MFLQIMLKWTEISFDTVRIGVSLVSDKMSTLWSETYQMQNPVADVNGTRAVIADKDGTTWRFMINPEKQAV